MNNASKKHHLILTTNGVAGACAAAAVLIRYPEAHIQFTSPRHLYRALDALHEEKRPIMVHLCGVGVSRPHDELTAAFRHLGKNIVVMWYSGTEYPEITTYCKGLKTRVRHKKSGHELTAHAILETLKVTSSARSLLLIELTEEAHHHKPATSELHRYCHDLVRAANRRFFFFGDDALNEKAIRYLAGLENKDDELDAAVEQYRRSPDALYPLGSSRAMKTLRTHIGRLGPVPEPVLIIGPTGSGKEVMAKALHVTSGRTGAFVAVNCAVLGGNPTLIEDRLFGHVKGAFTGADNDARGAFEEAHQGTLFLDEIGELPAAVQAQLLRVLEEKEVRPLGTMKTRALDVRIVAATHRDLTRMVAEGSFRQDLFYRINVLIVRVPPLCERLEDMKSIAAHIVGELEKSGYTLKLTKQDWDSVEKYDWPGNVRQFLNVLKRAAYLASPVADIINEENRNQQADTKFDSSSLQRLFCPESPDDVLPAKEIYRTYVQHVLGLFEGNIMRTAKALEIAPNTLRKHSD